MKKILLLATGGTIASRPTAAGGLAPAITSEELLACVPDISLAIPKLLGGYVSPITNPLGPVFIH
mgnify:CR=1 FL=1